MRVTVNAENISGTVQAIASKSMAHRYLICAALSDDITRVRCENRSDDVSATVSCLKETGASFSYSDGGYFVQKGALAKRPVLDCGESGSTLRFLLPVAAAVGCEAKFLRGKRLSVRPIEALTEELKRHGCSVAEGGSGEIFVGGKLLSGYYTLPGNVSSQFISGLLFALPLCSGDSILEVGGKIESLPYIKMTVDALKDFGVEIEREDNKFLIKGNQKFISPKEVFVEGDWTASSYWLSTAFLGSDVKIEGLSKDSLQGDKAIAELLEKFSESGKVYVDATDIPDLVPSLAVAASCRDGICIIYNAGRLRLKESDRIKSVCKMLKALGANCTETADGLKISGGKLHSGNVDAENDHRIAMAAAVASVRAGDVTIEGAECVSKSYPAFWEDMRRLGASVIID